MCSVQMLSTCEERCLKSVSSFPVSIKGASDGYFNMHKSEDKEDASHPHLFMILLPWWGSVGSIGGCTQCTDHSSFLSSQAQRKHGKQSLVPWQCLHFWVYTRKCDKWHIVSRKHTWESENFAGENVVLSFMVLLCINCLLGNSVAWFLCCVQILLAEASRDIFITFGSILPLGSCITEQS